MNAGLQARLDGAFHSNDAERYKFERDGLLEFIRTAPVQTGVCCCGNDVDKHGMDDGHNPVDTWDHAVRGWVEQIEKADKGIK